VSGIVSDFKDLVKQQLRLTRQEIETVLTRSKLPVSLLAVGQAVCYVGAFAVCLTLAHLIHWLASPAGADPASLPLWVSYGIAASLFLIAGVAIILMGKQKFDALGPPLREMVQALEDNFEWKTNKRTP